MIALTIPTAPAITTTTLLEYFCRVYRLTHPLAKPTGPEYERSIGSLGKWIGHEVTMAELSDDLLNRWLAELCEQRKPKTVRNKRNDVLVVWRAAARDGLATRPGDNIRRVKLPRPVPVAWWLAEYQLLLQASDTLDGYLCNGLARRTYFRTLLEVGYQTGLRRGDLFRLSVRDLEVSGLIRTLQGKTLDGHVCAMEEPTALRFREMAERLRSEKWEHAETPLRWPNTMRQIYYWWSEIRRLAGITGGGSLQQLRRTGATYVERDHPGAAMRFLGHRTPGLAYRHYVDRSKLDGAILPPRVE